ncbi:MAG: glycosyltransferase [Lishizhenia sp.]
MNTQPILYLSYDGMTDPLGQSQVLSYLIELTKKGYHFHLISFEKPTLFEQHGKYIQELCKKNKIDWQPLIYTKKPPVLSTFKDIRKLRKKAFATQAKYNIELVHCRSYITALVGLKLKQKKKTKLLFDMRGFWADERLEGNIWNKKNILFRLIYNYFKGKERVFLSTSDTVISLTHNGKKEILSWSSNTFTPAPIQVIPCCANLDLFNPNTIQTKQKSDLLKQLNLNHTTKILGYVGSIGTWYMLKEMMLFYAHFRTQFEDTQFVFVSAESPTTIKKEAEKQQIPSTEISIVSVIHKDVPKYISLFDYSVFFIRPSFSKKASSPVKQGELMAMGIPVICNEGVGDTDEIVKKNNAGITISTLTSSEFSKIKLNNYTFNPEEIRSKSFTHFSLEQGVELYATVYRNLFNKK